MSLTTIPKFIIAPDKGTKINRPLIIHTGIPKFIARVILDDRYDVDSIKEVAVWEEQYNETEIKSICCDMQTWLNAEGWKLHLPIEFKIKSKLKHLHFLGDKDTPFTVDQVREIIRIVFPQKKKNLSDVNSYALKHKMEQISTKINFTSYSSKYCSNDILIEAFKKEGYNYEKQVESPNYVFNISKKDLKILDLILRGTGFNI